jgi:hypothetical protein
MRWIQVRWGSKTFGIATANGKVAEAAPVLKWAIGKPEAQVARWLRSKGATFSELPGPTVLASTATAGPSARAVQECWCAHLGAEEIAAAEQVMGKLGGEVIEVDLGGKRALAPQRLCSGHTGPAPDFNIGAD